MNEWCDKCDTMSKLIQCDKCKELKNQYGFSILQDRSIPGKEFDLCFECTEHFHSLLEGCRSLIVKSFMDPPNPPAQ